MNTTPENIEKILNEAPDLSVLMGGYSLTDGVLKADVECNEDVEIKDGLVILRASEDYDANSFGFLNIETTLVMHIKAFNIAFIYFPNHHHIIQENFNVFLPEKKERVILSHAQTNDDYGMFKTLIQKGDKVGYGLFMPITQINTINFIKKDGTT